MKITAISDTHNLHRQLEILDGDLLIHAGDFTLYGSLAEVEDFNEWLGTLPHRHKVIIAGNHDAAFQTQPQAARALITNALYLQDESITIEGVKIYGSPWQPWHANMAFNLSRGEEIAARWSLIPPDTDVLVTHGPPKGICDQTFDSRNVGCEDLLWKIQQIRPKLHIFGHIHESAGLKEADGTVFINASNCDIAYQPVIAPTDYYLERTPAAAVQF